MALDEDRLRFRLRGLTVSKKTASRLFGGEKRLIAYIENGKVSVVRDKANVQNGKWHLDMADVIIEATKR